MRRVLTLVVLAAALTAVPVGAADDAGRTQQWALDRIGPAAAGSGAGVTVAVLDTGVDLGHVDLRDRVVPGIDLVDDDAAAQDENGHGTHVAGIIGATAGNGAGIVGVAPAVSVLPVRVLDADGSGSLEDVVAGIRWAVAHGADVLNLSLSEDAQAVLGPSLGDALREAWAAGVVPVIAAGNQYVLGSGFADEPAIVVSATTRDDGKPSYSSSVGSARWGMAAPGGEQPMLGQAGAILSTYWVAGAADQYAYDAGTSMAAPHVAGAVAILLGLGLSPSAAVDRLLATAADIGAPGRDDTFGAGRLDLAAATAGLGGSGAGPAAPPPPAPRGTQLPQTTAASTAGTAPGTTGTSAVIAAPTMTFEPGPSTTTKLGAVEARAAGDDASDADDASRTVPAMLAAALALAVLVATERARRDESRVGALPPTT